MFFGALTRASGIKMAVSIGKASVAKAHFTARENTKHLKFGRCTITLFYDFFGAKYHHIQIQSKMFIAELVLKVKLQFEVHYN